MFAKILLTSFAILLGNWASAGSLTISANGGEVSDTNTGLIWRRCAEGMVIIGGTCAGQPTATTSQEQALQLASAQAAAGWRLPNVKELASIVDRTKYNPSIDGSVFPATPANWYWSSSPSTQGGQSAWLVYFIDGSVASGDRNSFGFVRLVRRGR